MAFTFTDWTSVDSNGTIAEELTPASYFELRYATWMFAYVHNDNATEAADLVGSLGGVLIPMLGVDQVTFTQQLRFQIIRDSDIIFDAVLECEVVLTAEVVDVGAGTQLGIYTWSINPNHCKTTVTLPDPPPPVFSGDVTVADPPSGGATTNAVAQLLTDLVAPVYEFELEPGDRVAVPFHHAGQEGDGLVKLANVELRTILGGGKTKTLRDPRSGETWTVYKKDGKLRSARTRRTESYPLATPPAPDDPPAPVDVATTADENSVVNDGTFGLLKNWHVVRRGATLFTFLEQGAIKIAISRDEGKSWEEPVGLVNGFTLLAGADLNDTVYLVGKATAAGTGSNGTAYVADDVVVLVVQPTSEAPGYKVVEIKKVGGGLPNKNLSGLARRNGQILIFAQDLDNLRMFASGDGLSSVAEIVSAG